MEFQSVVNNRKMVRSFQSKPIPDTVLQKIIVNMLSGPSAGYSQGTQLYVISDKNQRELFFEQWGSYNERSSYREKWPDLENAPVIIMVLADESRYQNRYNQPDKANSGSFSMPWWYVDAGMAVLLGLLSSVDQQLAATFTGVQDQNYLKSTFDIPNNLEILGSLLIGYQKGDYRPSQSIRRGKRPIDEIVHYNQW